MIAGVGNHSSEATPAAILEAEGVRVVFMRHGDRFAHRIDVRDESTKDWTTALASQEGSDEDHWPPSPPFQQLHVEHRKEGDVVLLVGMAGRSHWSAAVDVSPDGKTLRFDVAVRLQTPGASLGSTYDVVDRAAADRLATDGGAGTAHSGAKVRELGSGEETAPHSLGFHPAEHGEASRPATLCWKYQLGLKPSP